MLLAPFATFCHHVTSVIGMSQHLKNLRPSDGIILHRESSTYPKTDDDLGFPRSVEQAIKPPTTRQASHRDKTTISDLE